MAKMTKDEREKLLARKAQIEARLKEFDAREQVRKRKEDTRAKIIYGSLAMEHAMTNPDSEFAAIMNRLLNRYVDRPGDRKILGLPPRETAANDVSNHRNSDNVPAQAAPVAESA